MSPQWSIQRATHLQPNALYPYEPGDEDTLPSNRDRIEAVWSPGKPPFQPFPSLTDLLDAQMEARLRHGHLDAYVVTVPHRMFGVKFA